MSELYTNEPPTSGKVIVETNYGNIDIELFTLEAPKSCRNFIQHCLNKYYNGCIFFKIFKNFIIQTGDPTNTGNGGESIYSEDFRDELHSRLKFNHRGIVAMANKNKPNSNGSQFFITLDKCPEMDKIYTIFGKVTGPTYFNAVTISNLSANEYGFPSMKDEEKPKITNTEVVINPFKDLKAAADLKNDVNNGNSWKKTKKKKKPKNLKIKYSPNKMFIQDSEDEVENKDNEKIKEKDGKNIDEDIKEEKEEKNEIKEEENNEEAKLNDNNNKEIKESKEQLEENENKENIELKNKEKIEDNNRKDEVELNGEIKEKKYEENNIELKINKETENNEGKDEDNKNEEENKDIEVKEENENNEDKDVYGKEENEDIEDKDADENDGEKNNEENENSDESESKSLSSDDHEVKNAKESLVDEEENIRKNKRKNIEDYKREINLLRKKVKKEKEEIYNDEEFRKKIEEEKVNKMNILQKFKYDYVKANQVNKLSSDERANKLKMFKSFIEGGDSERWYKTKLKFQTDSQKAFTLDMINKELEKNGNGNADDNI